jgi:hypothetical protein
MPTKAKNGRKGLPAPGEIRKDALALYAGEAKKNGTILSPIAATKALAERYGVSTDRVASPVALAYYRENGRRNPLPVKKGATDAALRRAILSRRNSPGVNAKGDATLGRWETIAAAATEATGTRVSPARAKALYAAAAIASGRENGESYIGRGTFAAAPSLREKGA